jgi:X-Pro dipeptidyl-peptidase
MNSNLNRILGVIPFICVSAALFHSFQLSADSGVKEPAIPVFKDGEAQVVDRFNDSDMWIRHDLWVETEFDSDDDGKLDRMHVDVTRPRQTDTEDLKLPVVYVTSPYFAGTGPSGVEYFWDPRHEVGAKPPEHKKSPEVKRRGERPSYRKVMSKPGCLADMWWSIQVHLEQAFHKVAQQLEGDNESLAPKSSCSVADR